MTFPRTVPAASARRLLVALIALEFLGCMGDTRPKIVIEWGIAPEELEGLEVEIDGKIAGKLARFGEATRTAFAVDKGEHRIRIVHPTRTCETVKVDAALATQRVMLIADFRESVSTQGAMTTVLTLRP
jgi:hypothetical protein